MATDNQLEAIRERHNQQPPSTITKSEWDDIDYLLAKIDRLKRLLAEEMDRPIRQTVTVRRTK